MTLQICDACGNEIPPHRPPLLCEWCGMELCESCWATHEDHCTDVVEVELEDEDVQP